MRPVQGDGWERLPVAPYYVRDYLARLKSDRELVAFEMTALRARSVPARELIAWQASGQQLGLETILSLAAEVSVNDDARRVWRTLDPRALARLARVIALQAVYPGDAAAAHVIYSAMERVHGQAAIPRRHLVLAAQLAVAVHDFASAASIAQMLPKNHVDRRYVMCDLANPFGESPNRSMERWLARFNELVVESGADELFLSDDPSLPPFDRIGCNVPAASIDGPLVTVMISSWWPDHTLETAVRSILAQSWGNLEVLLIDDASPPEYEPVLRRIEALDSRIRLIRQERNAGTYVARNRGLAEARGAYFTVHDSDDWAHPRRIEAQVGAIERAPGAVASQCVGVRADDRLQFNFPGVAAYRTNESSLLFATGAVRTRLGYYDPSRKGADSEYSTRLRKVFGEQSCVTVNSILSLIRLSPDSLSRSEFRPGWRHPARAAYRRNFEGWHGRTSDLRIPEQSSARKFPLPRRFRIDGSGARHQFDFAFLGDFRRSAPLATLAMDEIAVLALAGPVAVIQADSFLRLSAAAVDAYAWQLERALLAGTIEEIELGNSVDVDTLVVLEPDLLPFLTQHRASLRARRVVLLAANGPIATDGRTGYRPELCEEACQRIFGVDPRWIARDAVAAEQIGPIVDRRRQMVRRWPHVLARSHWRVPARLESGRLACGMELDARLPAAAQLRHYDGVQLPEMRIWVHDPQGIATTPVLPMGWRSYGTVCRDKATFLGLLDVWVDLIPRGECPRFPLGTLQAMAAGCIPVLDPSWQVEFGPAAVYAGAEGAAAIIRTLQTDPHRKSELRAHGSALVEERAGTTGYRDEICRLVGE
jgi:O-antigen biosynthesis protein